ncbi:MAG: hypothetical protein IID33_12125 [Planctomycetes bacterium]|nr:hypothetical protein [Planctomycetota bacterium]
MSRKEAERLLASAPTRRLSPEAERRILDAIATASPSPAINWWMRRVPLWQAAAACLVLCLATLGGARALFGDGSAAPDPAGTRSLANDVVDAGKRPTKLVRVDKAVFGLPAAPEYRVDITKWQFQPSMAE